jgi:hypothetical protein
MPGSEFLRCQCKSRIEQDPGIRAERYCYAGECFASFLADSSRKTSDVRGHQSLHRKSGQPDVIMGVHSPGMSVRPVPSTTLVSESGLIGVAEIFYNFVSPHQYIGGSRHRLLHTIEDALRCGHGCALASHEWCEHKGDHHRDNIENALHRSFAKDQFGKSRMPIRDKAITSEKTFRRPITASCRYW